MGIYIAVLVLALSGVLFNVNKSFRTKRRYIFFIFSILILISALRKYTIGIDLNRQYYNLFIRVTSMEWGDIGETAYDIGYVAFNKLIATLTDDPQWFIAAHSIIVLGITGWFILKYSDDVVMSTVLFIANNTWFMYMNVLRQALAISLILIAFDVWQKKEWKIKRYIIFAILLLMATSCHSSAALMIVIPFMEKVKFKRNEILVSALFVGVALLMYDRLFELASGIIGFRRNYSAFYEGTTAGGSAVNLNSVYGVLIYVFFFALAYYALVYRNQNKQDGDVSLMVRNSESNVSFLMYMTLFLIVCRVLVWRSSIIGRMAYYFIPFTWIIAPMAIRAFPGKSNRHILRLMIYSGVILAFLLIGYNSADVLYGTVPYQFFWK